MHQNLIDDAARNWNKTKDPKYKDLWYKLVKEFANGTHNIKRWSVSIDTSHEADDGRYCDNRRDRLF